MRGLALSFDGAFCNLIVGKMSKPSFSPGFFISLVDIVVLFAGLIGAISLGFQAWWAGFIIGFVVFHFFLFCNVFRIPRASELIWAFVFFVLAGSTILTNTPGWSVTFIASMVLSSFLVWKATKGDAYHGICWRIWNPNLKERWLSQNSITKEE